MLSNKKKKKLIDWHISADGPKAESFLRHFRPNLCAQTAIWYRNAKKGFFIPPSRIRNIYLTGLPRVKAAALKYYMRKYKLKTFIETGTYLGATTKIMAALMEKCITVELDMALYNRAVDQFKDMPHVICFQGNSGRLISKILAELSTPALFWLDAHYSGGMTADAGYDPLLEELDAIVRHKVKQHVILIDDARIHDIETVTRYSFPNYKVQVKNDIIRLTPAA